MKVLNLKHIKNAQVLKYFILCYYFFRSLVLRGPVRHFQLLFGEWYYERKYRIRTSGFKRSESERHYHYQAASYVVLNRILREITPITKNYAFYDIGCGKGRVVFIAAEYGYKKVYGIELDADLLEVAKHNIKPQLIKDKNLDVIFIQKNVLDYMFENQAAVYFLFNPFNAGVMDEFIERVMGLNKQSCYFVYMNPLYSVAFESKLIEPYKVVRSFLYTEAIIYRLPKREEELK